MITGLTGQHSCHANTFSSEVKNLSTSEPEKKSAINEGIEMPEGIHEEILRSYDGLRHRDVKPKDSAESLLNRFNITMEHLVESDSELSLEQAIFVAAKRLNISDTTARQLATLGKWVVSSATTLAGIPTTTKPEVKHKPD
ncbi:hypothetical protein PUG81_07385 [Erwiniaceae bacterium L1_54_6]|jgi:hypothetical protein|nr:hypothetical protein [Erwiniaceae bacterium L1_54_6]